MDSLPSVNVVALAGGVGGAKLAHGLAQCLPPEALTIIVNTGDDFEHLGLRICPDLDTVCYTLAGLANPATGWGRADETWNALSSVDALGGPAWFRLGDRDIGVHLERTRRLRQGQPLSRITQDFCRAWGVGTKVLPMTDDSVATFVYTEEGELPFQEYFVHRRCQPKVSGFRFASIAQSHPAPGVLESLREADLVVMCPSNPWVSVDPILAIPGVRENLIPSPLSPEKRDRGKGIGEKTIVAVSPIIGGKTVKGPAAKMYAELGIEPSALAVARHYQSLLTGFVLDSVDASLADEISSLGIRPLVTNILMPVPAERKRLAEEVLYFAKRLSDNQII